MINLRPFEASLRSAPQGEDRSFPHPEEQTVSLRLEGCPNIKGDMS